MAMFPASIGHRMMYDDDGSTSYYFVTSGSNPTAMTPGDRAILNNEITDTAVDFGGTRYWIGVIFPELRDIEGFYINTNGPPTVIETSADTTNGYDGTWVARQTNPTTSNTSANAHWQSGARTLSVSSVKAIRHNAYENQFNFHIYGKPSAGQNPDRLILWDPVLDQQLAPNALHPGDGGDVTRGLSYDKQFRIKNNSLTLTANNILVSVGALSDNSPSVASMFQFSTGGGAYNSNLTIPSIAAGTISPIIDMRINMSASAANVAVAMRVLANPQSMS